MVFIIVLGGGRENRCRGSEPEAAGCEPRNISD